MKGLKFFEIFQDLVHNSLGSAFDLERKVSIKKDFIGASKRRSQSCKFAELSELS